jgi:hypothetical protein
MMKLEICFKLTLFSAVLAWVTVMAADSNKVVIESARLMERRQGLTITTLIDVERQIRRTQQIPSGYRLLDAHVSPDGTTIAWSLYPDSATGEKASMLEVLSPGDGALPVLVGGFERRAAVGIGLSTRAELIVAVGIPLDTPVVRRELLVIDRHLGKVVYDLTKFVAQEELGKRLETLNVSGTGTLLALGQRGPEQIRVIEIPSGKTVYETPGRFPHLSPDGKRLAFVNQETIWTYSFGDDSIKELSKAKRVKGLGGWSPDGRFVLAGAWATGSSFEKSQIIVDTDSGEYGIEGELGEGDYGTQLVWVLAKFLKH